MYTYIISRETINPNKLHDYLIAHLNGFHKTTRDSEGYNHADIDCGRVSHTDNDIIIDFPESFTLESIQHAISQFNK